jgi:hypothetical protein
MLLRLAAAVVAKSVASNDMKLLLISAKAESLVQAPPPPVGEEASAKETLVQAPAPVGEEASAKGTLVQGLPPVGREASAKETQVQASPPTGGEASAKETLVQAPPRPVEETACAAMAASTAGGGGGGAGATAVSGGPASVAAAGSESAAVVLGIRKFNRALGPRIFRAAVSYATAASSAVSKVPSHTLAPCRAESRISAANFPHGLCLTPLYPVLHFRGFFGGVVSEAGVYSCGFGAAVGAAATDLCINNLMAVASGKARGLAERYVRLRGAGCGCFSEADVVS